MISARPSAPSPWPQTACFYGRRFSDEVTLFSERIYRAATQLQRLADDLVDKQNLARGAVSVHLRTAPVPPLLEELRERFVEQAARAQVRLRCEVAAPLPAVSCDVERLVQALSNLVANALAHAPAGGEVLVLAAPLGCELEIAVYDDGPGVPPADLPRLFEPYFRGSASVGPGMGLGLAIVRHLIGAHRGRVMVRNRRTGGACFSVFLPVAPRREYVE